MKAVYPSLSYALFTVIGIVALSMLLVWIGSFSENVQNNYAYDQLNYAADIARNSILDMYSSNASGMFQTSMPKRIIGRQYSVQLEGNVITLSLDTGKKRMQVGRALDVNVSFSGRSYAPAILEMTKDGGISIRLV